MACAVCSSETMDENGVLDFTNDQWIWIAIIILGFGVIVALNK